MAALDLTLTNVLGYVARGWPVLPIYEMRDGRCTCGRHDGKGCSPGKHPRTPHGVADASLDVTVVAAWHRRWPGCNWAIATGHALPGGGNLLVVDVDPRNDGDASLRALEAEHGPLPETVRQLSGGAGEHRFLRSEAALSGWDLAEGIEIKGLGGYLLVEPSNHLSGGSYRWDAAAHPDEVTVAAAPAWLLERRALVQERPEHSSDDAAGTFLGEAFRLAGWLGRQLHGGKRIARCPWWQEHSDDRGRGDDSSTVLLPATAYGYSGMLKCCHAHCAGRRFKDILAVLPPGALAEAALKYPRRTLQAVPEPMAAVADTDGVVPIERWQDMLLYKRTRGGAKLKPCVGNVITILRFDDLWRGRIRWNAFSEQLTVDSPPWGRAEGDPAPGIAPWTDNNDVQLQAYLGRVWDIDIGVSDVGRAVGVVGTGNAHHPAREYLSTLVWDGVPRVDRWLVTYYGADDKPIVREMGLRWIISAVARVMRPGCQADSMLVLQGQQGVGKSSSLRELVGREWFSDSAIAVGTADAYQLLRGRMVVEVGEMSSFTRAEREQVKAYISAPTDHYRASYGRRFETHPRQCVFAGTTNREQFLDDPTGARRFWPVRVGAIDREAVVRDRDQIWAETVARYARGEQWHITDPTLIAEAAEEAEERTEDDPLEGVIRPWLARADIRALRGVTTHHVMLSCLKQEPGRLTTSNAKLVGAALRKCGMVRKRVRLEDSSLCWMFMFPGQTGTNRSIGNDLSGCNSSSVPHVLYVPKEVTTHIRDELPAAYSFVNPGRVQEVRGTSRNGEQAEIDAVAATDAWLRGGES